MEVAIAAGHGSIYQLLSGLQCLHGSHLHSTSSEHHSEARAVDKAFDMKCECEQLHYSAHGDSAVFCVNCDGLVWSLLSLAGLFMMGIGPSSIGIAKISNIPGTRCGTTDLEVRSMLCTCFPGSPILL